MNMLQIKTGASYSSLVSLLLPFESRCGHCFSFDNILFFFNATDI